MVLYIINHVKRYIGGTRLSDEDYDRAVSKALVAAKGRITMLPARVNSTNVLTFIPGSYATNSIELRSFAYAGGSNSISSYLNSSEEQALKRAMIDFYNNQGISPEQVADRNISTISSNHYYDQGTVNPRSIGANGLV